MKRPNQFVALYINDISRCELWTALRETCEKHKLHLVPAEPYFISVDDEDIVFDKTMTREYMLNLIMEKFLNFKYELYIGSVDWEEEYAPDLWIRYCFAPWRYELKMDWEDLWFYDEKEILCQHIEVLFKDLFVRLPCSFGFGCHEYLYERQLDLLRIHESIQYIPTLSDKVNRAIEIYVNAHLKSIVPKSLEEAQRGRMYVLSYIWVKEKPVWFYLLSKERYEASKLYLPNLPVEDIEKFPGLQGYGVKQIEELPNGGAFIFLDYPYRFDDP